MDVGVDATGSEDLALAREDVGIDADGDGHPVGDIRVSGFADGGDEPVGDGDVCLIDAHGVQDDDVGDHHVGHAVFRAQVPVLAHAGAHHLAATKHGLFAGDREVFFDGDE